LALELGDAGRERRLGDADLLRRAAEVAGSATARKYLRMYWSIIDAAYVKAPIFQFFSRGQAG
jgi:hypothetical protein